MKAQISFKTLVRREDEGYIAFCPEVGTSAHGTTRDEAVSELICLMERRIDEAFSFQKKLT
ncbi:MAG: type II toxin-antitoxin system HicB family antitoxin [Thermoplasmatota archaeon]